MAASTQWADSERGRIRITAVQAMELRDSAGQSLVRVETDAGLFGIGEAGASGPATRANLKWLEGPGLGIELQPQVLRAEMKEGEPFWD